MVAFAGRKYAARSIPAFVANSTYTVTSFTLVSTHISGSCSLTNAPSLFTEQNNSVQVGS